LRTILDNFNGQKETIDRVLSNLAELDKWELRRLLREEGIRVRLRTSEVVVPKEERKEP
jgi:hypothetical protein